MKETAAAPEGFWRGARDAAPIVGAYLMIGAAAGLFGAERGLSPAEIVLLSLLLFAGSAQFVFPELYEGPPPALALAIFFINLRHLLYSAALAQQARRLGWKTRAAVGAQLTDETFLVSTAILKGRAMTSGGWMIGLNMTSYLAWCGGNLAGATLGGAADLSAWGADFAGLAMFVALLFLQIAGHSRPLSASVSALIAAVGAGAAMHWFPGPAAIIVSAVVAAALGALMFGASEDDKAFAAQSREKTQ